jgi:hypothetical protein
MPTDQEFFQSADPDQPSHSCHLTRIYTDCFLVRNNLMNKKCKQCRSWSDGKDVPADLDLHCLSMDNSDIPWSKGLNCVWSVIGVNTDNLQTHFFFNVSMTLVILFMWPLSLLSI